MSCLAIQGTVQVSRQQCLRHSGSISHDLRTSLAAICGYLDLLHKESLSDNAKRYLSLIENRTDAKKQLTEELLKSWIYHPRSSMPNQL